MNELHSMLIHGRTRSSMPRGAKGSLALNKPEKIVIHSDSNTTYILLILFAQKPMEDHRGQKLPTRGLVELKDSSNAEVNKVFKCKSLQSSLT